MSKILVTGGSGFIGSNVAVSFAKAGHKVVVIDNLSRKGTDINLAWIKTFKNIYFYKDDIRIGFYENEQYDVIFHFAAQTGVIPSIDNPTDDFSVNAYGTLQILEYARKQKNPPLVIYASTNKVYGDINVDKPISEEQPLNASTPYGCSKAVGDLYVQDYYYTYGVPTVVLRMSCIYGDRQLGNERENGWLCHFMRNKDNEVTLYGDGSQVRDCLYIDDYVELMHKLIKNKDQVKGEVFNIGGGKDNAISVNEVLYKIGNTNIKTANPRISDQKYYVSDIHKIEDYTGWKPTIGIDEGLERLKEWTSQL